MISVILMNLVIHINNTVPFQLNIKINVKIELKRIRGCYFAKIVKKSDMS